MGTNASSRAAPSLADGRLAGMPLPDSGLLQHLGGWLARLEQRREVARQRRALLDLDQHLLADIGLTRDQAWIEATKGFWHD